MEDHEIDSIIQKNHFKAKEFNMYFQILKLKVWSFLLLQYHQNRDKLKQVYAKQNNNIYDIQKDSEDNILEILSNQVDLFMKQLYVLGDTSKKKRSYTYISSSICNLTQRQVYLMSQKGILFWNCEDLIKMVVLLKLEEWGSFILKNRIDGFVMLILMDPLFEVRWQEQMSYSHKNVQICYLLYNQLLSLSMKWPYDVYETQIKELNRADGARTFYCHRYSQSKKINDMTLPLFQEEQQPLMDPIILYENQNQKIQDPPSSKQPSKTSTLDEEIQYTQMMIRSDELQQQIEENNQIKSINVTCQNTEGSSFIDNSDRMGSINMMDCSIDVQNQLQESSTMNDNNKNKLGFGSLIIENQSDMVQKRNEYKSKSYELTDNHLSSLNDSQWFDESQLLNESLKFDECQQNVNQKTENSIHQNCVLHNHGYLIKQQTSNQKAKLTLLTQKINSVTLQPAFFVFDFTDRPRLLLQSNINSRLHTVLIRGCSFGRCQTNTYSFPDQTRISSKHARIIFNDETFWLQDLGSKGGTFLKVRNSFLLEQGQQIFIGRKLALRITDTECKEKEGTLSVEYESGGRMVDFTVRLKLGKSWKIGRDKSLNQTSFQKSAQLLWLQTSLHTTRFHKILSPQHCELNYDVQWKNGVAGFTINDLNSCYGTWVRLGEKSLISKPWRLQQNQVFNLSFDAEFEIIYRQ